MVRTACILAMCQSQNYNNKRKLAWNLNVVKEPIGFISNNSQRKKKKKKQASFNLTGQR